MATLALAAALSGAFGAGAPGAAASDECVYFGLPYEQGAPIVLDASDPLCATNPAIAAAIAEARQWPTFDPSDMTAEIAVAEANREAATWPDFDPSDMTAEIAATEAEQEAATWPDFDSTAIDTSESIDVAANSPRMTQIAAEEATGETAAASGNPFVL